MAVSDRTSLPAVFRARTPKALPSCDGARDHQTTPPSRPKAVVRARAQISSSERRGGEGSHPANPSNDLLHFPNAKGPLALVLCLRCAPGWMNLERRCVHRTRPEYSALMNDVTRLQNSSEFCFQCWAEPATWSDAPGILSRISSPERNGCIASSGWPKINVGA